MNNRRKLLMIVLGVGLQTQGIDLASAESPRQIAQTAYPLTVKVLNGKNSTYTGVLVNKTQKSYEVLSCGIFLSLNPLDYQVVLDPRQVYSVQSIRRLSANNPLVVLTFVSNQVYPTARLGNSQLLAVGDRLYLSGFLGNSETSENQTAVPNNFLFTEGIISSIVKPPQQGVYNFTHTNMSYLGMEGSPLFDSDGELVGINCGNQQRLSSENKAFNLSWGVGINLFKMADFSSNNPSVDTPSSDNSFSTFGSPPPYPKNRH